MRIYVYESQLVTVSIEAHVSGLRISALYNGYETTCCPCTCTHSVKQDLSLVTCYNIKFNLSLERKESGTEK